MPLTASKFEEAYTGYDTGFQVNGLTRDGSDDVYDYEVEFLPFTITQMTNGQVSATTADQVYFENRTNNSAAAA